tara:strand:- start:818 stop:1141 length:324 start_codon:yes stop_codon:yes gene_type:complete
MQTDVRQTIAVAATAQLQKYVKTTATDITKARIMAITAQASGADASVKIYNTVGAATASKLVAELKFGTADGEWTHFYVPGQGIYCDTGLYAVLSNCDFLVVTGTYT